MLDNFSEYNDPCLYDMENKGISELSFLISQAKRVEIERDPILELACGTGRITIPFAENGYSLIGVDLHEGMLSRATQKGSADISIQWIQQDCRYLELDHTVSMAYMVGHGFQHFLTNEDQDELLQSVRTVLKKDGIFVFDTRFPSAEELLQPCAETFWRTVHISSDKKCDLYTKMVYDSITQIQYYTTIRRFFEDEKMVKETESTISLRYSFVQELKRTLNMNGFSVYAIYNDWKGNRLEDRCYSMVVVCVRR